MDWTKAKTILIIAFLITNVFLGTHLLSAQSRQTGSVVDETYVQQTLNFLADQGVVLETEIPRQAPSLSSVTVSYLFHTPAETAERFLGPDWTLAGSNIFESAAGRLTLVNEKQLMYQQFEPGPMLPAMNEGMLEQVSRDFLEHHALYPEGLFLSQIYVGVVPEYHPDPLHKLVYQQTYQGRFIGESYVHVYVNQRGVVAVEALLLKPPEEMEQAGAARTMIDAPEALLRVLDQILQDHPSEDPVLISRIEAGYYFALPQDPLTRWEVVASGTAVPAWKIVLKNGDTYYQEAF